MRLVIKYPTRGRPKLFCETLKKWRTMLSGRHHVHFLVSIDEDDTLMNSPIMHSFMGRQRNLRWYAGHSKTKIQAVNADLDKLPPDYDILVLASDDMIPVVKGYDDVIATHMKRCFPNLDGCLHFEDGLSVGNLNTLPILGRKLVEGWGFIYHPDYISEWCDNWMQEVTRRDGKEEMIPRCIIKHEWAGLTGQDQTFRKNQGFYSQDKATFERHKAAGFPLR